MRKSGIAVAKTPRESRFSRFVRPGRMKAQICQTHTGLEMMMPVKIEMPKRVEKAEVALAKFSDTSASLLPSARAIASYSLKGRVSCS